MRLKDRLIEHDEEMLGLKKPRDNSFALKMEKLIRETSPLPVSYDVDCNQGINFSELTYTEFLGGLLISTQSVEVNTKLRKEASTIQCNEGHVDHIASMNIDKYKLDHIKTPYKHVGFMVGHNMFDLVSPEIVARLAHENKEFHLKLHPITNDDYAGKAARIVGWDRIIPSTVSGVDLIDGCDVAYVTTATELCALAVAKNKKVVNISSFFNESIGAYYSINTFLFKSHDPRQTLNNIIGAKFSGLFFPWMDDVTDRLQCFYDKVLDLRSIHSPLSSPNNLKKVPADK